MPLSYVFQLPIHAFHYILANLQDTHLVFAGHLEKLQDTVNIYIYIHCQSHNKNYKVFKIIIIETKSQNAIYKCHCYFTQDSQCALFGKRELRFEVDRAYEIYHQYYYLLTQHNHRNAGQ